MKCFYLVWSENSSDSWNDHPTHRHCSYEEATGEAIKLSTRMGRTFYVLKAVSEISPPLTIAQVRTLLE